MITLEKAILHIFVPGEGNSIISEVELPLEAGIKEFILQHIEKTYKSQNAKAGKFYVDSSFSCLLDEYIQQEKDFVLFSQEIARSIFELLDKAKGAREADLFICQVQLEGEPYLALLKCDNSHGYIHQATVAEDGRLQATIVNSAAILPSLTQKMEEFIYISLKNKELLVKGKKYNIDGNNVYMLTELLLECEQQASPAETLREIDKAVKRVAEEYCRDQVAVSTAVKEYIADSLEEGEKLDPKEIGRAVFREDPSMQEDYIREIEAAGTEKSVHVDKEATLKKIKKHRLSTDTGIELTVPTELFADTEFIEFIKEENGSISITLKNIQNITNK